MRTHRDILAVEGGRLPLPSVAALALALFHRPAKDCSFMPMVAYLDESGTQGKGRSPVMVVASLIGTVEGWAAYETAVKALFDEFDVKKFHAKRFRAKQGEFRPWPKDRWFECGQRLIALMGYHLQRGIAVSLRPSDYKAIYRAAELPKKIRRDSAYGLCFRVCLLLGIHYMLTKGKEHWPLSLILESGHPNAGDAVRIFDEVNETATMVFGEVLRAIAFDTKDCLALTAPDVFAHTLYRTGSGAVASSVSILPPDYPFIRFQNFGLTPKSLKDFLAMHAKGQVVPKLLNWEAGTV